MSVLERVAAVRQRKFIWSWIVVDYHSNSRYQKARENDIARAESLVDHLREGTYLSLVKDMTTTL